MAATNGSRIEILESAFVSSEEGNLFVQLAHAYRDSGDRLRAFRILRRGIEQHPSYGPAYELLGRVLLDQERIAEAEAVFERLLELEPRNTVARGALDDINQRMRPGPTTAATSLGTIPIGGPPAQQTLSAQPAPAAQQPAPPQTSQPQTPQPQTSQPQTSP